MVMPLLSSVGVRFQGKKAAAAAAAEQVSPMTTGLHVSDQVEDRFQQSKTTHGQYEQARTKRRRSEQPSWFGLMASRFAFLTLGLASVGTMGYGGKNAVNYVQTLPQGEAAQTEAEMKQLDRHVGSSYRDLNKWLTKTQKSTQTYAFETQQQIEFQQHAKAFMESFVTTLRESNSPDDKALANKINLTSQDKEARIDQLGVKLYDQVQTRKKAGKSLDLSGLIQNESAFKHLSDREKERFAMELYTLFNQHATLDMANFQYASVHSERGNSQASKTIEREYRDILDAYAGNPVQGLSLERFKSVQNPDEARQLLGELIIDNYTHLNEADQALFQEKTQKMLKVLDYTVHESPWWLLLYGSLASVGGAATMLLASSSLKRVKKGLKPREAGDLTLKVIEVPAKDYETWDRLNISMKETLNNWAQRRVWVSKAHPELKPLLMGNSRSYYDLADSLKECLLNEAHAALVKKGRTLEVGQLELTKMANTLLKAYEAEGNELIEWSLATPNFWNEVKAANKAPFERILVKDRSDIQRIHDALVKEELAQTLQLLNHLLKSSKTGMEVETQKLLVACLKGEKDVKQTGVSLEGKTLPVEEKRLATLESNLKDDAAITQGYQTYLQELATKLLQCEVALVDDTDEATLKRKLLQIQALERTKTDLATNPVFTDLSDRVNEARLKLEIAQEDLRPGEKPPGSETTP